MLGTIVLLALSSTLAGRHLALLGRSKNPIFFAAVAVEKGSKEVCNGNGFTLI